MLFWIGVPTEEEGREGEGEEEEEIGREEGEGVEGEGVGSLIRDHCLGRQNSPWLHCCK